MWFCTSVNPSEAFATFSFCVSIAWIEHCTMSVAICAFAFNSSTMLAICSVDCLVSSARFRIWSATTAKPFPASPALALSIEAFNARRFVWLEIEKITSVICWTSFAFFCKSSIDSATRLLVSLIESASFRIESMTVIFSSNNFDDMVAASTIILAFSEVSSMSLLMRFVIWLCSFTLSTLFCVWPEIVSIESCTILASFFKCSISVFVLETASCTSLEICRTSFSILACKLRSSSAVPSISPEKTFESLEILCSTIIISICITILIKETLSPPNNCPLMLHTIVRIKVTASIV